MLREASGLACYNTSKTDLELMGGKKEIRDHRFVIEHAADPKEPRARCEINLMRVPEGGDEDIT